MKNTDLKFLALCLLIIVGLSAVAVAKFPSDKNDKKDTTIELTQGGPPPGGPMGKMGGPGNRPDRPGMKGQGRPGGPMGGGPKQMPGRVSDTQVKKFEAWLKVEDPDKYKEMQEMKEMNEHLYKRVVFEGVRHWQHLMMLKKKDPDAYALVKKEMTLNSKMQLLVKKYRESSNASEKKQLKPQINEVLNQLFDVRTKNRSREVKKLQEQVAKLNKMLEKRKANKKLIVERKLQEVTGESDGLEW